MNPTLLTFGGYGLPSYGVLAALGILAAVAVAWRLGRGAGFNADLVLDAVIWMVIAGFVGARVGYLAVSWGKETASAAALVSGGGGVYLAGLASGAGALVLFCRRRGISWLGAADVFAPALALGHAFGRVGCHLAGCCWGCRVGGVGAFVGVRYPAIRGTEGRDLEGSWPFLDHLRRGWVGWGDSWSQPVVPVQLLEAGFNLLLFGALLLLWGRRKYAGQVALVYLAVYGAGRFGFEYLRGDADRGLYGPFSVSQWASLVMLGVVGATLVRMRRGSARADAGTRL